MEIGNAKLAFGLAVKVFDDMLKALHERDVLPRELEMEEEVTIVDQLKATVFLLVEFDPPEFGLHFDPETSNPYTRLDLRGRITPRIGFAGKTSPNLFTIDFSMGIKLAFILFPRGGRAPLVGLDYAGVEYVSDPLEVNFVERYLQTEKVQNALEIVKLDVLTPVVNVLKEACYFNTPIDQKPSNQLFPVRMQLMAGEGSSKDAIGLFIGLPGMDMLVGNIPSIVPSYSELVMHISDEIADKMKENGKNKLENFIKGFSSTLEVSKFELSIDDDQIDIEAKITENATDSSGTISGYFHFRHVPGMETMFMDGSNIDIDIELPWWMDLLAFLIPPIDDAIRYVEQEVPDLLQKTVTVMINGVLGKIKKALTFDDLALEGAPVAIYTHDIALENNSITAYIQILIQPIAEHLKSASYSTVLNHFVFYTLESGRKFYREDLARFMGQGLIIVPGYHPVKGTYLRANPDNKEKNNLTYRWGR
jgi:hypothetical protein